MNWFNCTRITCAVYSTNIHFVSTYLIISTSHVSLEINEIRNMRPVYCITSQKYHNQDSSNLTVRASGICLEGPGFNLQSGHLFCLTKYSSIVNKKSRKLAIRRRLTQSLVQTICLWNLCMRLLENITCD